MGNDHDSDVLKRFSFTLPPKLVENVDKIKKELDMSRSMVVREALSHWTDHTIKELEVKGEGVALISYIYDHHDSRVISELMETHHSFEDLINSTTHLHMTHSKCYEITICKGELRLIKKLADLVRSIKGLSNFNINIAHD